jgi:hypothetical protein
VTGRERRDNPWARRNLLVDPPADPPSSTGADGAAGPAVDVPATPTPSAGRDPSVGQDSAGRSASGASPGPSVRRPEKSHDSKEKGAWSGRRMVAPVPDEADDAPVLVAWYATDRQRVDPVPRERRLPIWSGPVHAHLGGADSDDLATAGWWWLGVHGGAGVSTLAALVPGGAHAHRLWPDPAHAGPRVVVLVCRAHLAGLEQARDAARQWASADVPAGLLLGGAVAVADAPGRITRPQAEALRLLTGAVPRLWTVPWIEDLRAVRGPAGLPLPPAMVRLRAELDTLRRRPARERGAR